MLGTLKTAGQMKYLESTGLDEGMVDGVRALLRQKKSFLEIEKLTGIKYSIIVAIRYGKFFK